MIPPNKKRPQKEELSSKEKIRTILLYAIAILIFITTIAYTQQNIVAFMTFSFIGVVAIFGVILCL